MKLIQSVAIAVVCACVWQAAGTPDRKLLGPIQGGCPAGCRPDKCVEDKTTARLICTKCANNLVVIKSNDPTENGQCGCRAGRYHVPTGGNMADVANRKPTCTVCTQGSFCPGGSISSAVQNLCSNIGGTDAQPGLTTAIKAAKTQWACVEKPGWGYKVVNDAPTATKCGGDTYNSGYSKRQCQACPTGFQIDDANKTLDPLLAKHDSVNDCMVPPGYYLRSPSEVAPCPQGEYQQDFNRASKCVACPPGVTTARGKINVHAQFCNTLKPGYFAYEGLQAKTFSGDTGHSFILQQDAKPCPQKHWCPGGAPTATYTNITVAPDSDATKVFRCSTDYQAAAGTNAAPLWTKNQGAKSKAECLVPPGYGQDESGDVLQCGSGYFREGWVQPADTDAACQKCAETDPDSAVTSAATESLTEYPNLDDTSISTVLVIGSSSACEMKPGYGMYQTAKGIRVAACLVNSYGSPNVTYGRSVNPCRQCPTSLVTPEDIAAADATIKNANTSGYTSPLACMTRPGYGFDGRVSTQCPVGTYNSGGNQDECTECLFGFSTEDDASKQVTSDNCLAAPGYEATANGTVRECPLGTYSIGLTAVGVPCAACSGSRWTVETGATNETDCTACAPGYGKSASSDYSTECTDCALLAGYGSAARDDTECQLCPTQQTGFTFLYNDNTEKFIAAPVISSAQTSATQCLSSFAQIESGLWYLHGADQTLGSFTGDEAGINSCAGLCAATDTCMFFTFDYSSGNCFACFHSDLDSNELVALKAVPSGDILGAQSSTAAKAVASGTYTAWYMSSARADAIGTSSDSIGDKTTAACMAACDMDGACAAVRMPGMSKDSAADAIAPCQLIYGESSAGKLAAEGKLYSRSLTRTVVKGAATTAHCTTKPTDAAEGIFDCPEVVAEARSSWPGSCKPGYEGSLSATCIGVNTYYIENTCQPINEGALVPKLAYWFHEDELWPSYTQGATGTNLKFYNAWLDVQSGQLLYRVYKTANFTDKNVYLKMTVTPDAGEVINYIRVVASMFSEISEKLILGSSLDNFQATLGIMTVPGLSFQTFIVKTPSITTTTEFRLFGVTSKPNSLFVITEIAVLSGP